MAGSVKMNPLLTQPACRHFQSSYRADTGCILAAECTGNAKIKILIFTSCKAMAVNLHSNSELTQTSLFHFSLWCPLVTSDTPVRVLPWPSAARAAGCGDNQLLLHEKHIPASKRGDFPALPSSRASSNYNPCIKSCKERDNVNILIITGFLDQLVESIPSSTKCIHFFTCWYSVSLQVLCVYLYPNLYLSVFKTLTWR